MSDSRISRELFSALRRAAKADKDGFVAMCDLLKEERLAGLGVTKEQLLRIVADCQLKRFELKTKGRATSIRASPRIPAQTDRVV
jgi:RNA:NAD 2'-phosphotransferase (TPT1/KptA family)